jgi:predicted DNA-binding protein with PD1-like motif
MQSAEQSAEQSGIVLVRLFPGEDIFESLKQVCTKYEIRAAIIMSAVGQIRDFTLGYFNGTEYRKREFIETHELLSLSGMISQSAEGNGFDIHLHAVTGDDRLSTHGGHLFRGTAEGTNEIALLKTLIPVTRRKDPGNELMGLYLE